MTTQATCPDCTDAYLTCRSCSERLHAEAIADENASDPAIARMLRAQLGTAIPMFGASNLLDTGRGLQFKIGRNPKRVTHIAIELAADDTYTVKFSRVPSMRAMMKGAHVVTLAECETVHVGELRSTLELHTGLLASL